jgi:hypothetical protein
MISEPPLEVATEEPNAERLSTLERIIETGLQTFIEVGNALTEIRDSRLYRRCYHTFEDYCRERWQMTRMRASQLISAAAVVANVNNCLHSPTHESQVRALANLEPEQQREAWKEATQDNPKPTAKRVAEAVAKVQVAPEPVKVPTRRDQANVMFVNHVANALKYLGLAGVELKEAAHHSQGLPDRKLVSEIRGTFPEISKKLQAKLEQPQPPEEPKQQPKSKTVQIVVRHIGPAVTTQVKAIPKNATITKLPNGNWGAKEQTDGQ